MIETLPPKRLKGAVRQLLKTDTKELETFPRDALTINWDGIENERHAGVTRPSSGLEPWYQRGTTMRNYRQISLISVEDLSNIATTLNLPKIEAGWLGNQIVIEGIADLSLLPPRTILFFEGGVSLRVDGYNAPCRFAGKSVAIRYPERDQTALELDFVKAGQQKRGLVAMVERPGTITAGEQVTARLWERWLYDPQGQATG